MCHANGKKMMSHSINSQCIGTLCALWHSLHCTSGTRVTETRGIRGRKNGYSSGYTHHERIMYTYVSHSYIHIYIYIYTHLMLFIFFASASSPLARFHCWSVPAVSLLLLIMAARELTCTAMCLETYLAVSSQIFYTYTVCRLLLYVWASYVYGMCTYIWKCI